MTEINILGTTYQLIYKNADEDIKLDELEAYTDFYKKEIVVCKLKTRECFANSDDEKLKRITKKIIRHELIHAFLYESGLDCNSNRSYSWAENEEMIDWFAIQSPKIYEVYQNLELLGETND